MIYVATLLMQGACQRLLLAA